MWRDLWIKSTFSWEKQGKYAHLWIRFLSRKKVCPSLNSRRLKNLAGMMKMEQGTFVGKADFSEKKM